MPFQVGDRVKLRNFLSEEGGIGVIRHIQEVHDTRHRWHYVDWGIGPQVEADEYPSYKEYDLVLYDSPPELTNSKIKLHVDSLPSRIREDIRAMTQDPYLYGEISGQDGNKAKVEFILYGRKLVGRVHLEDLRHALVKIKKTLLQQILEDD